MQKRLLTVLLAVCLVFALGTVTALAAQPEDVAVNTSTNETYADLGTAVSEAEDGQTVRLLTDCSSDSSIVVDKNLTLELNGHVITNNVEAERLFHVTAAISFTVDGSVVGSGMEIGENVKSYGFVKITAPATVTLDGGSYTGDTDNDAFIKGFNRNGVGNASGCSITLNGITGNTNTRILETDTLSELSLSVSGGSYTSTSAVTDNSRYSVFQ